MENTQDLSACVTKLQENVLQWENRLIRTRRTGSVSPGDERAASC